VTEAERAEIEKAIREVNKQLERLKRLLKS